MAVVIFSTHWSLVKKIKNYTTALFDQYKHVMKMTSFDEQK